MKRYDPDDTPAWVPGLHFVLALTTWSIAYPFVNTALRGLFFDISVDERHRVKIVRYAEIANVVATTALLPMDKISYSLNNYDNFQYGCLVVAAISCTCFELTGLSKWGNDDILNSENQPLVGNEKNYDLEGEQLQFPRRSMEDDRQKVEELFTENEHLQFSSLKTAWIVSKEILSSKNFWFMAGTYFTFWFRTQTIGSFFAIFTEILVSPDILPTGSYSLAIYYTLSLMLPRVVLVVCTPIAHKIGTKKLIMFTMILTWINSGVGLLAGLTISANFAIVYLLIESVLLRFQSMFAVIACDFIEEDTIVHNRKLPASTLIFTLNSSVVKSTISLAPLLTAAFLASSGYTDYQDNLRETPQKFKNLVSLIACGIPAVCALIGFVLFNFYVSYKDRPEICAVRTLRKFSSYERIP
uniref:Uncharacterized protein n=1 Tax=Romanomermis culicivorax TaxID=13658 RepID=A0A915KKJ5_ROMCU